MTKETESRFKDENTPKWLKTIQLNSWEAELLISALVLYALFQVPDYLNEVSHHSFERGSEFIRIFNMLKSAISILQIGYILHISVRGVWVASVGFSYVFPKGINSKNLGFKGKFKKELERNPSLVKNVLRLEELSSMIYGLSFTLFGTFIGLSSLLIIYIVTLNYLSPYSPNSITDNPLYFGLFTLFYLFSLLAVFIDFITSGLFRRKGWAVDWFYPIAWVFRVLTLSFLYRRSLLVLMSNLKGWKARFVSLFVAAIVGGYLFFIGEKKDNKRDFYLNKSTRAEFLMENYESMLTDGSYLVATIKSDIIDESYLKLFLKDLSIFNRMKESPFDRNEIKWDFQSSDSCSYYLNKWLKVSIDSMEYGNLFWVKSQHPTQYDFGFHTYLDIDSLGRGPHRLSIVADTLNFNKKEKRDWDNSVYQGKSLANILFHYNKK